MKYYLFLVALIIISLSACKKDKNITGTGTKPQQLPPITTEGKNTFGCLVNGEVWLPEVTPFQMLQYPLVSSYQFGNFMVLAKKNITNKEILEVIELYIKDLYIEDVYILDSPIVPVGSYGNYINFCFYVTDTTQIGELEIIKLDTINKIIAGTFEMKLWKDGCDTINITEGRFDVKFAQ